jgi:hypothetical protein
MSAYQEEVEKIEKDLNWTEEDASNCGCNSHPGGPCQNCWSLGWRIGGIVIKEKEQME